MLEPGIAIEERNAAVKSVADLYFGTGKAVAAGLRMDLQAPAIPLHDIVVADDAFVGEAADAFQILGSWAPGFFRLARRASELAIVVGDEAAQHGIGRVDVESLSQTKLTGQAILQHTPEALDAAFGLRALGGDEGDAKLLESPAKLSGLALAGELFIERPVIVVANEDAAAIAVEGDGNTAVVQEALEQAKVALGGFRGDELGGEDFAGKHRLACPER